MTPDALATLGADIDNAFFLIAAAIFGIEIIKAIFTRSLSGRSLLDMLASASTQIPYLLVEIFILSFTYVGYVAISDALVSWKLPLTTATIVLAVIAADYVYYWEHRFAHEIRILWTQHAVHHSSRFMNMFVAARFGPFEGVASAIIHLPLILIGFPPETVIFGALVVLSYQTWIHTEVIGKLGPLDAILNTPSNHRVHHGCDDKYIDKNYGGILIIWDRIFGTYQREEETPNYGLKRDYSSVNPISVWFSEMPTFFRDLKNAKSAGEVWMLIFGPPGWRPAREAPAENGVR